MALALFLLALAACSGGGGSSSPTEPETRYFLVAAGAMQNLADRCCLSAARVRLDGRDLETFNFPQGPGVVVWNINVDGAGGLHPVPISRGSHEVTVAVAQDPRAPSRYRASGDLEVTDDAGNVVLTMDLPRKDANLNLGQGLSWSFSF